MPAYEGDFRFERHGDPGQYYPYKLVVEEGILSTDDENRTWGVLSSAELESLRDDIDALLNPPKSYVSVSVIGHGDQVWHYEDPSGELQVDDLVRVPFGQNDVAKVAIVRSIKAVPPTWLHYTKSVLAKFTAEEL